MQQRQHGRKNKPYVLKRGTLPHVESDSTDGDERQKAPNHRAPPQTTAVLDDLGKLPVPFLPGRCRKAQSAMPGSGEPKTVVQRIVAIAGLTAQRWHPLVGLGPSASDAIGFATASATGAGHRGNARIVQARQQRVSREGKFFQCRASGASPSVVPGLGNRERLARPSSKPLTATPRARVRRDECGRRGGRVGPCVSRRVRAILRRQIDHPRSRRSIASSWRRRAACCRGQTGRRSWSIHADTGHAPPVASTLGSATLDLCISAQASADQPNIWLIRDRDQKSVQCFDAAFHAQAIRIIATQYRAPQVNGIAERFVRRFSVCLDWLLILNALHLERVLSLYRDITISTDPVARWNCSRRICEERRLRRRPCKPTP